MLLDFEIGLSGGFYLVSYHLLYKNILTHESKAQPYTICFPVQKYAKKYVYLKYDILFIMLCLFMLYIRVLNTKESLIRNEYLLELILCRSVWQRTIITVYSLCRDCLENCKNWKGITEVILYLSYPTKANTTV